MKYDPIYSLCFKKDILKLRQKQKKKFGSNYIQRSLLMLLMIKIFWKSFLFFILGFDKRIKDLLETFLLLLLYIVRKSQKFSQKKKKQRIKFQKSKVKNFYLVSRFNQYVNIKITLEKIPVLFHYSLNRIFKTKVYNYKIEYLFMFVFRTCISFEFIAHEKIQQEARISLCC